MIRLNFWGCLIFTVGWIVAFPFSSSWLLRLFFRCSFITPFQSTLHIFDNGRSGLHGFCEGWLKIVRNGRVRRLQWDTFLFLLQRSTLKCYVLWFLSKWAGIFQPFRIDRYESSQLQYWTATWELDWHYFCRTEIGLLDILSRILCYLMTLLA